MSDQKAADLSARIAGLSPDKRALLAERLQNSAKGGKPAAEPIAVIGMACRFPGADTPDAFWELLRAGIDAVTDVPLDRWDANALYNGDPSAPGKVTTRRGGFLEQVDAFDAGFFGISPREASRMDPQQRIFLEVAWEAFERAGQTAEALAGSKTGVFLGVHSQSSDYASLQLSDRAGINAYSLTGTAHNVMAGRLSYLLDLKGPSIAVDTACSSSLVAIHLACQSLRTGETALALVGGTNLILTPEVTIAASRMQIMSPDGRCRAFDAGANGFARSEGCGVVILKRLSDALASGDPILAILRGSAVNQDGHTNGIAAPNGTSQQLVIREALRVAGVAASDVTLVEAHGTGTSLGDPIEVEALAEVFGFPADGHSCTLGSAKTNIGHLEGAAGVASLIKAVLSLRHREIPPLVHFQTLNPHITIGRTRLKFPREVTTWEPRGKRIAGVSSFGFSGTNAHVIVEEPPAVTPSIERDTAPAADTPRLVPISARSIEALNATVARYDDWLASSASAGCEWKDLAWTGTARRSHHSFRASFVARSKAELSSALRSWRRQPPRIGAVDPHESAGLVFVFPGQGSQRLGMGAELMVEKAFADAIHRTDRAFREETDWSLLDVISGQADNDLLQRIDVIQPALFGVEIALAALWRSWGFEPDVVVGHSMGEVAAACVAGALTLEDAARVICRRSKLLRGASGRGAMAVVELTPDAAREELRGLEQQLSIAACNSPRSTVVSGDRDALDALLERLRARDIFCRHVRVDVASHSPQMDALAPALRSALADLRPQAASVPFQSTVTGQRIETTPLDGGYWMRNLREPVQFAGAIRQLLLSGYTRFIEMSPHPILLSALQELAAESERDAGAPNGRRVLAVGSLHREQGEREAILQSLGALYEHGATVSWRTVSAEGRVVDLPTYPWQREQYWLDRAQTTPAASHVSADPRIGHRLRTSVPVFEVLAGGATEGSLSHGVGSTPVMSSASLVGMAMAACAAAGRPAAAMEDVAFATPVSLDRDRQWLLQTVLTDGGVQISGAPAQVEAAGAWETHFTASIAAQAPAIQSVVDLAASQTRCQERATALVLAAAEAVGIGNGKSDLVREVWRGSNEWLVELNAPDASSEFDPLVLDAALRPLIARVGDATPWRMTAVRRLQHGATGLPPAWSHIAVDEQNTDQTTASVTLFDASGASIAVLEGVQVKPVAAVTAPVDWVHELTWKRVPLALDPPAILAAGRWLIVEDACGVAREFAQIIERHGGEAITVQSPYQAGAASTQDADPGEAFTGIVHLASLDLSLSAGVSAETPQSREMREPAAVVLRDFQLLSDPAAPVPFWAVTRGGQSVRGSMADSEQAAVWGLGRVISLDEADSWGGLIDLDPAASPRASAEMLWRAIRSAGGEDQMALRGADRFVPRIVRSQPTSSEVLTVRRDGTYVITGGLGRLGLLIAEWLASRGAGHLLLVGRTALPPRSEWSSLVDDRMNERIRAITSIEALGAKVGVVAADAADPESMRGLFARSGIDYPPIRGIVHGAGVFTLNPARTLTPAELVRALRPKVDAARVLDACSRQQPIDFFVLFSSGAGIWGTRHAAHYAAANQALDAFADGRRREGLPATSINWGWWAGGNTGDELDDLFGQIGLRKMSAGQALDVMGHLAASGASQRIVVDVDWPSFHGVYAAKRRRPMLEDVAVGPVMVQQRDSAIQQIPWVAALPEMTKDERLTHLTGFLRDQVADILGLASGAHVDPERGFFKQGMDSLMTVQLRTRVAHALGCELPSTIAFEYPSVRKLAHYLADPLGDPNREQAGASNSVSPSDAELTTASEEQLADMLDDVLKGIQTEAAR